MRKCVVIPVVVICSLLPAAALSQSPPAFCTTWGSFGMGPEQFSFLPVGVATDESGKIYIADSGNQRVQVFDYGPTAVQNTTWGRIKTMFRWC
ncbi:MAG: hypothetical protein AMJ46_06340 [Latescibacteria bacterium DG_63]|nr:MAG: hypothetical protein AMJ46_06340 [Latescibacteria bacterium DG_63]